MRAFDNDYGLAGVRSAAGAGGRKGPGCPHEFSLDFMDSKPPKGYHVYYVRLEQTNGMVAWSSPFFVTYE